MGDHARGHRRVEHLLDAVATAAGVLLVASQLLSGLDHTLVLAFLAGVVRLWGVGLRANLRRQLGAAAPDRDQHQRALQGGLRAHQAPPAPRIQRVAAGTGYVVVELAKEAPYYAGAFGAAVYRRRLVQRRAALPRGREPRGRRLRVRPRRPDAQAPSSPSLRVVRHRLGAAGVPGRLLPRRRAGRAGDDRGLRRRDDAGRVRRGGPRLRHRAHAPSRLPRRAQGLGDPPRRLPALESRTRSTAGAPATPPRTTGARSSATRSNAKASPTRPTRTSRDAKSSPAPRSRDCSRSTPAAPSHSTSATRRSSARTAQTPRPTIARPGDPRWRTSPAWSSRAACSSRPPCAAAARTWSATSDSRAPTSTSTTWACPRARLQPAGAGPRT